MRLRGLILTAGLALALAACGDKENANTTVDDVNLMSADDAMMANDTTAIDAATNMDANMAADSEVDFDAANISNEVKDNEAEANATVNNAM